MSTSLLLIHRFFAEYRENLILIFVFIVSYLTLSLFKKEVSKEERLRRQKMAEEYLKKYETEDEQFLYSNE
jgi:hypothetical protein